MDSTARAARARVAALSRHRRADDPQLVQARAAYADHAARMSVARLTPQERRRLLAALTADESAPAGVEPVNAQDVRTPGE